MTKIPARPCVSHGKCPATHVCGGTTGGAATGGTIGRPFSGAPCDDALAAVEMVELATLGIAGLAVVTASKSRLK